MLNKPSIIVKPNLTKLEIRRPLFIIFKYTNSI